MKKQKNIWQGDRDHAYFHVGFVHIRRAVIIMKRIASILLLLVLAGAGMSASAQVMDYIPYNGYEYNSYGESVPAPVGYTPETVYTGVSMGAGALSAPSDMYFSDKGELFILDSGNGRIVVTDADMNLLREIGQFISDEEEAWDFTGAQGLFVDKNDDIYVADTENSRVIIADAQCKIKMVLTHPQTSSYPEHKAFRPVKVIRDANGYIYVLSDGLNEGAAGFNDQGSFVGFFGYNQVAATSQVLLDYLLQGFMTKEQIAASRARVPDQITNFDLDENSFLYTVTFTSGAAQSVRRLNYKGSNTLREIKYGDLEWDRKFTQSVKTEFVDVDIDSDGYINLLDRARGRVFQYHPDGSLISVFGEQSGTQTGTFSNAIAVETQKGRVYVLDSVQNSLTTFIPTEYLRLIKQAISLTGQGLYDRSLDYWEQVRRLNSNNELSYRGIGKAYSESGKFKESLPYYQLANDHAAYSESFSQVRKEFVKRNFIILIAGIAGTAVFLFVTLAFLKRRYAASHPDGGSMLEQPLLYPVYTVFHPVDGFDELKVKNRGSYPMALGILIGLFFTLCASWFFTGFIFNQNRPDSFNVLIPLIQAFLLFFLWCISNWAMSTLMEGKGKMKDIVTMSAYALIPLTVSFLLQICVSHICTLSENSILSFVSQLGTVWSIILIVTGLCQIHQFSFRKTLLDILVTVLAMAVLVFLAILFYGLMLQLFNFIGSVYTEVRLMN